MLAIGSSPVFISEDLVRAGLYPRKHAGGAPPSHADQLCCKLKRSGETQEGSRPLYEKIGRRDKVDMDSVQRGNGESQILFHSGGA
ncbi:MAG: hypothetical protein DMG31_05215 [Acidobacteria bacterium]|nr:MAG: hypothetical protein DMG31_05215 [Acidobacteriota bacterium]